MIRLVMDLIWVSGSARAHAFSVIIPSADMCMQAGSRTWNYSLELVIRD